MKKPRFILENPNFRKQKSIWPKLCNSTTIKIKTSVLIFLITLPLSRGSFTKLEEVNFKIVSYIQNPYDIISLYRVSHKNRNLIEEYILEKYKFLKEKKYDDQSIKSQIINTYFESVDKANNLFEINSFIKINDHITSILEKEFFFKHQLNVLLINDDMVVEKDKNICSIIRDGNSCLKSVLYNYKVSRFTYSYNFLTSIFNNLRRLSENDQDQPNLNTPEEKYLYAKSCFLGSKIYPRSHVGQLSLRKCQGILNELCDVENSYQSKAQYFAWKYHLLFTNPHEARQRHQLLEHAAYGEHVRAHYELGKYYEDLALSEQNQNLKQQNYTIALKYYKIAADQKNTKALNQLGHLYLEGRGVPISQPEEALIWYMKAAFLGHTEATTRVGLMYYAGIGKPEENFPLIERSYQQFITSELKEWWKGAYEHAKACYWWRSAAREGDAEAQFYLGWMYQNGYGVEQNQNYANFYYKKAADQGDTAAMIKIGKAAVAFTNSEKQVCQYWKDLKDSNELISNFYSILHETGRVEPSILLNNQALSLLYFGKSSFDTESFSSENKYMYILPYLRLELPFEKILNLSFHNITDTKVKILIQSLFDNKSLLKKWIQSHTLDLKFNKIGAEGARALAQALKDSQIKMLDLSRNKIGDEGTRALVQALKDTKIQTLDLSYNNICAEGARALAQVLKDSQIHTLYLGHNKIGDAGAGALVQVLKDTKIQTLDLCTNKIGDEGAIALAQALKDTQIKTLNLSRNKIGDKGARDLGQALKDTQIKTLNLSRNKIGDAGAIAIAQALKESQIQELYLYGNNISEEMQETLRKMLPGVELRF